MYIIYIKFIIDTSVIGPSNKSNCLKPVLQDGYLAESNDGYLAESNKEYCIANKDDCNKFQYIAEVYMFLADFFNYYKYTPSFLIKEIEIIKEE